MSAQNESKAAPLLDYFGDLPDPRIARGRLHSLHDILVIAICGVICGADDWASIEEFGRAKEDWLKTFLKLPNGIPSHDTFGRVFAALGTKAFRECFARWIQAVASSTNGDVVAIDGKTLRRSFNRASSKAAIHMVSAWSTANGVVLGQVKTAAKSNEITAIPKLLELLELNGCIVTIDAMGCQTAIAEEIIDRGADYVLALKGNQEALHTEVVEFFDEALENDFANIEYDYHVEDDVAHGRTEHRETWCTWNTSWLQEHSKWAGLQSIAKVSAEREVNGRVEIEDRYYISSLPGNDAETIARAVRRHWGIENGLHWVLDVAFREDDSRVRKDNAPANLATLRHIAINLLKSEKTSKVGVKNRRLRAGWDDAYLLRVLGI